MDLKDFVRQTLVDIFDAVQEAGTIITADPQRKGVVAPLWGGIENISNHEQTIKFDVAVTAESRSRAGGGAGIKVLSIVDLKGEALTEAKDKAVSRVTFSIPVALPGTTVEGTAPPSKRSRKPSNK